MTESGKPAILVVGQDDWPFPIPLVQKDGEWHFDTAAGREEILARRIGRNELARDSGMPRLCDAQNEYADMNEATSGMAVYAQRIVSRPARRTGSIGRPRQGEPASPLGEAVAAATSAAIASAAARRSTATTTRS